MVKLKFPWQTGPRTNQAHLTAEYIEQLGYLIEPRGAQQNSAPYQSRIPVSVQLDHRLLESNQSFHVCLVNLSVRSRMHASELIDRKTTATPADTGLPK